jgi:hypothetical protein
MERRQEGLEPLDCADDLSSLRGEVEAAGRVIAQCNSAAVRAWRAPPGCPVNPRPGHLAPQHRDLVAQHEQLCLLGRRTPRQQRKPPQHLAQHQIEQSQGHAPIIAARWLPRRTRSSAPTTEFLAPTGWPAAAPAPRGASATQARLRVAAQPAEGLPRAADLDRLGDPGLRPGHPRHPHH